MSTIIKIRATIKIISLCSSLATAHRKSAFHSRTEKDRAVCKANKRLIKCLCVEHRKTEKYIASWSCPTAW